MLVCDFCHVEIRLGITWTAKEDGGVSDLLSCPMFRKLVVCTGVESRRGASSHGAVYPKVVTWHVKHTEAYWGKVVITLGELVTLLILCNFKTWTNSDQILCSTDSVHLTPLKCSGYCICLSYLTLKYSALSPHNIYLLHIKIKYKR